MVGSVVLDYTGIVVLRVQGSVSSVIPTWDINPQSEMLVDCETGREILAQYPHIRDTCQFCSIDVEGAEEKVIQSIDWNLFKPKVLCVEYPEYHPHKQGKDLSANWHDQLRNVGYTLKHTTQLNKIYLRG